MIERIDRLRRALALRLCPALGLELDERRDEMRSLAQELATVRAAAQIAEKAAAQLPDMRERLRAAEERAQVAEAAAGTARDEMVLAQEQARRLARSVRTAAGDLDGGGAAAATLRDVARHLDALAPADPDPRTGRPGGADLDEQIAEEIAQHREWITPVPPPPPAAPEVSRSRQFLESAPACCADLTCTGENSIREDGHHIHCPTKAPAAPADRAPNMRRHRWKRPVLESTPCLDCGVRFEHARGPCPGPKGGDGGR